MPIYYMFLAILLFVVICFFLFKDLLVKEGMDAEEKSGDITANYDLIEQTLKEFSKRADSFVKNK